VNNPRITHAPREDATPESSWAALARCYAYLIERRWLREQKKAGAHNVGDEEKGTKDDLPVSRIIPCR